MPYSNQPPRAFWRQCRDDPSFLADQLYRPKFTLDEAEQIATAGSCFAQHIGRYIRRSILDLVDVEPAPRTMPHDVAHRFGYGLYSARYGNIYTARQLRQLLQDVMAETVHDCAIWQKDARFYDALRPNVEPEGLASRDEVIAHRLDHLKRVRNMFETAEVFIFTLGLTETWADRASGLVFPTAPGVIAGTYDDTAHRFINLSIAECYEDLSEAVMLIRDLSPRIKILLTVSPVPLTATATDHHVLRATTYSKSVLRAVAEEVAASQPKFDYFPSYEVITGAPTAARYYSDNLRSVTDDGVRAVMSLFFGAHDMVLPDLETGAALDTGPVEPSAPSDDDLICEEAMLEAFASK